MFRSAAWQRAKGELNVMIETFYNDREKFVEFKKLMDSFVNEVEDNELYT